MSEDKSFFEKNMEMWERWTSSYMDTMASAMEKTMEQSSALQKQVDKAVATAVASWRASDLETAIVDAGGCAAALRSLADWRAHPAWA